MDKRGISVDFCSAYTFLDEQGNRYLLVFIRSTPGEPLNLESTKGFVCWEYIRGTKKYQTTVIDTETTYALVDTAIAPYLREIDNSSGSYGKTSNIKRILDMAIR